MVDFSFVFTNLKHLEKFVLSRDLICVDPGLPGYAQVTVKLRLTSSRSLNGVWNIGEYDFIALPKVKYNTIRVDPRKKPN
jgi:hypothetical protein